MDEKTKRLILIVVVIVVVLFVLTQLLPFLLGVVLVHGFSDAMKGIFDAVEASV